MTAMTSGKRDTDYACGQCGHRSLTWIGRCPACRAWGSFDQRPGPVQTAAAVPIAHVDAATADHYSCGVPELDRVLGGGLVPGAVILLAGEPGVGKSTLLLEVAAQASRYQRRTLYLTGEESTAQVRQRADRIGGLHEELYLAAATDLDSIVSLIEHTAPELVILDSVQTVGGCEQVGGVSAVREATVTLTRLAKRHSTTVIMVGHVTKDGAIAGPRALEHLVDVVLAFEGERSSRLRLIRAVKNRFGPADEIGCFEMSTTGISAVADPLFLDQIDGGGPGSCVTVSLEGRRPMLVEVQALVCATSQERPRRTTAGLDSARLATVLAVLETHCRLSARSADVFTATVGGVQLRDPAADLALALALTSARTDQPLPPRLVAIGEIGLSGKLRRVRDLRLRLAEAARVGFTAAIVPLGADIDRLDRGDPGISTIRVADVNDALRALAEFPTDRCATVPAPGHR